MTQLVHALVISQLDYANALYVELPATLLDRLQRIQNAAVRLIFRLKRRDHVTPSMKKLHWLPVRQRIDYKVLILTYNCINDPTAPVYLKELLSIRRTGVRTRAADGPTVLEQPSTEVKASFGARAFSRAAPRLWNSLSPDIRAKTTLTSFRAALKTHLFRQAYGV